MKANEAPNRLYLSKNIYGTYQYQVPDPDDETAVEYIRADAFIDKAATWFANRYQVNGYLDADDIEEFSKTMKGEQV